ncbi:MAG: hypothetical protein JSU86_08710, partial [Phycisphaerales bacterium]
MTIARHGQSLGFIIANVNRTTQGWFEYFKHTSYTTSWSGVLATAAVATHSSETPQDTPSQWSGYCSSTPAERALC